MTVQRAAWRAFPSHVSKAMPQSIQWVTLITPHQWQQIVARLNLSAAQDHFLWHALHDPRERAIAAHMQLTRHGAHAHRMAVFRKLGVDCMPAAIARVFAAYIHVRDDQPVIDGGSAEGAGCLNEHA